MIYNEVEGNLITMACEGKFEVIAHGCNCFCAMKRGIAPQMAEAFGCNYFPLELEYEETHQGDEWEVTRIPTGNKGDINKLGQIDYKEIPWSTKLGHRIGGYSLPKGDDIILITVVNCYTQYHWSSLEYPTPFDYEAFTLCMRKINHIFKGNSIGLPAIGSHLAGGNWSEIKEIIIKELKDCEVTIVLLPQK